MESFAATKLDDFEKGKITRRGLIESLTVAATTVYAGTAKSAEANPALKVALVNHISFDCPDYQKSADWYSNVFNLAQVGAGPMDVNLPLGREGEKPYNVTADDVPHPFLIMRTRERTAPTANAGLPRRQAKALIDSVGYTIADFDAARVRAELERLGAADIRQEGEHRVHASDADGINVQISGLDVTALSD